MVKKGDKKKKSKEDLDSLVLPSVSADDLKHRCVDGDMMYDLGFDQLDLANEDFLSDISRDLSFIIDKIEDVFAGSNHIDDDDEEATVPHHLEEIGTELIIFYLISNYPCLIHDPILLRFCRQYHEDKESIEGIVSHIPLRRYMK